jgi:hypothetical protein
VTDALSADLHLVVQLNESQKAMEKAEEEEVTPTKPVPDRKQPSGKLIVAEDNAVGHVSWPASMLCYC